MLTVQDYEHLTQLLLTHNPQRSDYILSESIQREFRQMRLDLEAFLQRLDGSTDITSQPSTELSVDQQQHMHSSCIWLIQNIDISIAPHKKLPAEIWSEIFMAVTPWHIFFPPTRRDYWLLPFETPVTPTTAWTLMQVCSRWRQIAKTTPELWKDVTISSRCKLPRDNWAGRIKPLVEASCEFLTRGTQLLDLWITIDALDLWFTGEEESVQSFIGDTNPIRDIISSASRQLSRISLNSSWDLLPRFFESAPLHFDSLDSLHVTLTSLSPFSREFQDMTVFSNAPKLHRIYLRERVDSNSSFKLGALSRFHMFQLPWGQLTEIHLRGAWITPASCYTILSQCPGLSDGEFLVSFTEPDVPMLVPAPYPTNYGSLISHYSLQSISFEFDFPETGSSLPDGFLSPLALPAVEDLSITTELCSDHGIEHSILSLIQRSRCTLQSFSFIWNKDGHRDHSIVTLDLYPIIASLSSTLNSLVLDSWPISRTALRLAVQESFLPKIAYFTCDVRSWECLSLFLDLVEARSRTHASSLHPMLKNATAWFTRPLEINDFSKQVKERAKIAMETAKEDGRQLYVGLLFSSRQTTLVLALY
ncbi:hypothetical protein Hypma_014547 [Hypsizygus marmoreus]|uniref:Uncharacterized protein n=1 Tax=Hypsizygus marmoreus TaxID=39966 RepID=A0A369J9U4_HYPMA|nr:hypothetical protein Hypma_014547 [Hypsizygus marmoreus]